MIDFIFTNVASIGVKKVNGKSKRFKAKPINLDDVINVEEVNIEGYEQKGSLLTMNNGTRYLTPCGVSSISSLKEEIKAMFNLKVRTATNIESSLMKRGWRYDESGYLSNGCGELIKFGQMTLQYSRDLLKVEIPYEMIRNGYTFNLMLNW